MSDISTILFEIFLSKSPLPRGIKGLIRGLIKESLEEAYRRGYEEGSKAAMLRQFRQAGGSIRTQDFYSTVNEWKKEKQAREEFQAVSDPTAIPDALIPEAPFATSEEYLYRFQVDVRSYEGRGRPWTQTWISLASKDKLTVNQAKERIRDVHGDKFKANEIRWDSLDFKAVFRRPSVETTLKRIEAKSNR